MAELTKAKRILVVDDDPVIIKLVETRLRAKGYEVMTSSEAPSGLEKALKQKPDLVILDVMMPIVNGYNFCRLLKTQEEFKKIPVVLLTSRAGGEDRKIGEEVGANAYLTKPFDMDDLQAKIKELLHLA
ncbi:MAG: response regulator [Candidatus Omnitrophota bacterium]